LAYRRTNAVIDKVLAVHPVRLVRILINIYPNRSGGFGRGRGIDMVEYIKPIIFDDVAVICFVDFNRIFCKIEIDNIRSNFFNERVFRLENILAGKTMQRKIGKTTFFVTKSFSNTASETVENMLIRYVSNQILTAFNTASGEVYRSVV
jgi:hypothetical protein